MQRTVLLEHTLPDGSAHYDWLIERPHSPPHFPPHSPPHAPPSAHTPMALISFRLDTRIDLDAPASFSARRIADHRPIYLTYEGPISRGRGSVRRLAAGNCSVTRNTPNGLTLRLDLGNAHGIAHGVPIDGNLWRFTITP